MSTTFRTTSGTVLVCADDPRGFATDVEQRPFVCGVLVGEKEASRQWVASRHVVEWWESTPYVEDFLASVS